MDVHEKYKNTGIAFSPSQITCQGTLHLSL